MIIWIIVGLYILSIYLDDVLAKEQRKLPPGNKTQITLIMIRPRSNSQVSSSRIN
jgi:hypothetical protein